MRGLFSDDHLQLDLVEMLIGVHLPTSQTPLPLERNTTSTNLFSRPGTAWKSISRSCTSQTLELGGTRSQSVSYEKLGVHFQTYRRKFTAVLDRAAI
jgi:hypothetical protein